MKAIFQEDSGKITVEESIWDCEASLIMSRYLAVEGAMAPMLEPPLCSFVPPVLWNHVFFRVPLTYLHVFAGNLVWFSGVLNSPAS